MESKETYLKRLNKRVEGLDIEDIKKLYFDTRYDFYVAKYHECKSRHSNEIRLAESEAMINAKRWLMDKGYPIHHFIVKYECFPCKNCKYHSDYYGCEIEGYEDCDEKYTYVKTVDFWSFEIDESSEMIKGLTTDFEKFKEYNIVSIEDATTHEILFSRKQEVENG